MAGPTRRHVVQRGNRKMVMWLNDADAHRLGATPADETARGDNPPQSDASSADRPSVAKETVIEGNKARTDVPNKAPETGRHGFTSNR